MYRSMKHNGVSRNRPKHIWWNNFQQRCQANSMGEKMYFQKMALEQFGISLKKNAN